MYHPENGQSNYKPQTKHAERMQNNKKKVAVLASCDSAKF